MSFPARRQAKATLPYLAYESRHSMANPPLLAVLDRDTEDRALIMFRDELRDTKEIAWRLEATEAAVANGIANARERARAR
ncbi:hypothetical protein ASE63_22310 [Bosea sp. Root381]|uniref:hypothetical protein n=1 Tax=Bosea sp. Root381 TaxID=1736524 RepID=UPI0006F40FAC|nr:hypothetical protein [Bosea sp. Root381]KRE07435.1 hypothetical protein ASE63_22310 [Bosea sp. Root381]